MSTFAIINNGVVSNIIVAEPTDDFSFINGDIVEYNSETAVGIGFFYDKETNTFSIDPLKPVEE